MRLFGRRPIPPEPSWSGIVGILHTTDGDVFIGRPTHIKFRGERMLIEWEVPHRGGFAIGLTTILGVLRVRKEIDRVPIEGYTFTAIQEIQWTALW